MADSIIDICNRALSQIAETDEIASFDDNTNEAVQCRLWYDKIRQRLLRAAPWGFARAQINLTQVGDLIPDGTSPYPFLWSYVYPADCLKFRYTLCPPILPTGNQTVPPLTGNAFIGPGNIGASRSNRFLIHNQILDGQATKVIISNVASAIGTYTKDETNPDIFDVLFTDALEAALSFRLCVPLTGNIGMQGNFKAAAEQALITARAIDGNEAIPSSDIRVDWMEARGVGGGVYGGYPWTGGAGGASWGNWYDGWEPMNWGM